jgi:hypothetical protein
MIFHMEDLANFDIKYKSLINFYIYSLHTENQNVKI